MNNLTLTAAQKKALEHRYRETRDAIESDRIKAVLLRSENWTIAAIPLLRLSEFMKAQ